MLYLLIDLAIIAVPLAFTWSKPNPFFYRWNAFWPACVLTLIPFILWDIGFAKEGIWGFNDHYLTGYFIAGLPLEEWLFFICVPYACVFSYHVLGERYQVSQINREPGSGYTSVVLSGALLITCLILAAAFAERSYTFVTSILCALFMAYLIWRRPQWLNLLWLTYAVLSIPFILANGLLTGVRFWSAPFWNTSPESIADRIVWYNNAENLGLRLFTIPLDDFIYGMLLIGVNVLLFESFTGRTRRADISADISAEAYKSGKGLNDL